MSVLERLVYPGVLCAVGIYYTHDRTDMLREELKEFQGSMATELTSMKGSMATELASVKKGLQGLLDRQTRLEQWYTAQQKKCMTLFERR